MQLLLRIPFLATDPHALSLAGAWLPILEFFVFKHVSQVPQFVNVASQRTCFVYDWI
jgi:hypothetical protein